MFNWFRRSSKSGPSADTPRAAAYRAAAARAAAARAAASRADSSRADSSRADSSRADSSRADSSRADSSRADSSPAGALQDGDPQALTQLSAGARQLSLGAQRVLAQLPAAVSLDATCAGYPHVVERLLVRWHDPLEFRRVLDSMVIDSRGGRMGFPFKVVLELGALREHYDLNVHPLKTSAWGSVTSR